VARVLLFAAAREAAGRRHAEICGDSVGAVMRAACARFGTDFERLVRSCTILVADEAVPADRWWDVALGDADEVAVLPPVSGG
jgi:molybdopterin synthase sulfur carrier subunit